MAHYKNFLTEGVPVSLRKQHLDVLRSELDFAHQRLRTAETNQDILRAQGRAQYLYGLIQALESKMKEGENAPRPQ
jgi:hypothetical protein